MTNKWLFDYIDSMDLSTEIKTVYDHIDMAETLSNKYGYEFELVYSIIWAVQDKQGSQSHDRYYYKRYVNHANNHGGGCNQ